MLKDLIEKIFRRKELRDLREEVKKKKEKIKFLTCGDTMHLGQHERRMILGAIELAPFRARVELPATKAFVRIKWRELREKLKMSIEKEDETKEADKEKIVPIPEKPNPGMIDYQYKKTEVKK